jgi:uncharacterized protein (TIGR03435 family)
MRAYSNFPMSAITRFLENSLHQPVRLPTGLSGNYDFTFQWQDPQQMAEALTRELEAAGLELAPRTEPIEMLVVEKAK